MRASGLALVVNLLYVDLQELQVACRRVGHRSPLLLKQEGSFLESCTSLHAERSELLQGWFFDVQNHHDANVSYRMADHLPVLGFETLVLRFKQSQDLFRGLVIQWVTRGLHPEFRRPTSA